MGRQLHKLSPKAVQTLGDGRHSDGGGLYLFCRGERRSWVFRYRWNDRLREMGLGGVNALSLSKAREAAAKARGQIAQGISPLDERRETKIIPTFGELAKTVVADLSPGWRNAKHKAQWTSTLNTHAKALHSIPVDKVERADVEAVLKPIWTTKPETASRLRGRIERVLGIAKVRGYRTGENPARWRDHLDLVLPVQQKLKRGHHKALPFAQVSGFIAELRGRDAMAALALEFTIYTAARSGEVRGARWSEMDLFAKVWTVPAARMKAGREHRVPLSSRAVEILQAVKPLSDGTGEAVVFPASSGKLLSDAAFSALLSRMGHGDRSFTPHGFRSSFRDWAGELSPCPREVVETALAHAVGDATERAYRRADALAKRRELMDDWAAFIEPGSKDLEGLAAKAGE